MLNMILFKMFMCLRSQYIAIDDNNWGLTCVHREEGLCVWGRCVLFSHAPPTSAIPHLDNAALDALVKQISQSINEKTFRCSVADSTLTHTPTSNDNEKQWFELTVFGVLH